ncbi:MAG TPA: hypothetical protein VJV03_11525 [Pyrinomonadaceae bacterium]|nr:hypothetical protein [Pyrinomonadaceae bacterium]
MNVSRQRLSLMLIVAVAAALLVWSPVEAQCSMCRTGLMNANSAFVRNFNIAVLVLLIPPVTIFCGIFVALRRYRPPKE